MGWNFGKILGGVSQVVTAGQVVTALFPNRTKKARRYLDKAEAVTGTAGSLFEQVSFSPDSIRTEADIVYGIELSEEEVMKVYDYLKRNCEQNKQAILRSLADERQRG